MMSDMFIHEIFKIHHRKWPEIHVCLNFSFYDDYERIFRIKNSSIKKSSRTIYSRLHFSICNVQDFHRPELLSPNYFINVWTYFLSPNPLLMYSANVKDSENADRWLAALSSLLYINIRFGLRNVQIQSKLTCQNYLKSNLFAIKAFMGKGFTTKEITKIIWKGFIRTLINILITHYSIFFDHVLNDRILFWW